jgi:hypothetical protein
VKFLPMRTNMSALYLESLKKAGDLANAVCARQLYDLWVSALQIVSLNVHKLEKLLKYNGSW